MPQPRRLAIALTVLALAGCVGRSADRSPRTTGSPTPEPSTATSVTSAAQDTRAADQVLTAAGLTLPAGAGAIVVRALPQPPATDRYLVNFTAAAAAVVAMCAAAGLNGSAPHAQLTPQEQQLFGISAVPPGSLGCVGSDPADRHRQRDVLFTGDPATVWVGVWREPAG